MRRHRARGRMRDAAEVSLTVAERRKARRKALNQEQGRNKVLMVLVQNSNGDPIIIL